MERGCIEYYGIWEAKIKEGIRLFEVVLYLLMQHIENNVNVIVHIYCNFNNNVGP